MHRPGAFEGRPPGGRMRTSFEAIFTLFFIGLIIGLPTDTDAQQGEEPRTFAGTLPYASHTPLNVRVCA